MGNKFKKFLVGFSGLFLMALITVGIKIQSDKKKIVDVQTQVGDLQVDVPQPQSDVQTFPIDQTKDEIASPSSNLPDPAVTSTTTSPQTALKTVAPIKVVAPTTMTPSTSSSKTSSSSKKSSSKKTRSS